MNKKKIVVASSVAFIASSVLIIALVHIPKVEYMSLSHPLRALKQDILDAAGFLKTTPIMWKTILLAALMNLVVAAFIIVGSPYMITEVLGLPNQLMGIAEGALALGGLIGGIAVSVKPEMFSIQKAPRYLLGVAIGIIPLAFVMALSLNEFVCYAVVLVSFSWTMAMCSVFSIVGISFLQMETPGDLIGKVIALTMSAANCAIPLGQLIFGFGFDNAPVSVLAGVVVVGMLGISFAAAKALKKAFGADGTMKIVQQDSEEVGEQIDLSIVREVS